MFFMSKSCIEIVQGEILTQIHWKKRMSMIVRAVLPSRKTKKHTFEDGEWKRGGEKKIHDDWISSISCTRTGLKKSENEMLLTLSRVECIFHNRNALKVNDGETRIQFKMHLMYKFDLEFIRMETIVCRLNSTVCRMSNVVDSFLIIIHTKIASKKGDQTFF
jgi:hypothetical protein